MKVLHVITGLGRGGAEASLVKLVRALPGVRHRIVSLLPEGPLADQARAAGAEVAALGMGRLPGPFSFARLVREVRDFSPDVVQTWLYHADLLGLAAARTAGRVPVAWNLRCSDMDLARYGLATRLVVRLLAMLSTAPEAIVSNSRLAVAHHQGMGYAARGFCVVPNGFDTSLFRPDAEARRALRASWGIADETPLVGYAGRLDPMKDIPTLCAALAEAARHVPALRAVICGAGLDNGDEGLRSLLADHGLADRALLLGPRDDMPRIMASLDCLALSSRSEGFPNVLGEAMACGVPCTTTDAGDAALVVGETGRVAPRGDAAALGQAVADILLLPAVERAALGQRARQRVECEFSLAAMGAGYLRLWEALAAASPAP